jgi:hypothetical protein
MPNVLRFRNADNGLGDFGYGGRPSAFSAVAHSSAQIARIRALQAQAKKDISAAILLLDIALVHGRLVSLKVDDQEFRRRLDEGLRVVEQLLAIARARTANL